MALATFDDLVTSIQAWLYNRPSLATVAPDFIRLAEAAMDANVRHHLMAVQITLTLTGELTNLPADFRGAITLANSLRLLTPVSLEQMAGDRLWNNDSCDQRYAILGDQLQVWPAPTNGDTATLVYMQAIPALSDGNATNWLLARWPNAYLYGALLQAAPYLRGDDRIQIWQGFFEAALASIAQSNRQEAGRALKARASMPTP